MSFINSFLGSSAVTLRHFAIGDFTLDVVEEESHQFTISSSESAVESGARITDHRVINPRELVIRGTVVNYEPKNTLDELFPQTSALLETIPLPIQVSAVTDQVRNAVGRAQAITSQAFAFGKKVSNLAAVASRFPTAQNFFNDLSETDDRISKFKSTLEQIATTETTIEVMTSTGLYSNIQIGSVSVVRTSHNSAEFQIYLKEILTYDVEIVGGIDAKVVEQKKPSDKKADKPSGEKKSDRPAKQAAKPQNKGKTQPQKSSNQSALYKIFN